MTMEVMLVIKFALVMINGDPRQARIHDLSGGATRRDRWRWSGALGARLVLLFLVHHRGLNEAMRCQV